MNNIITRLRSIASHRSIDWVLLVAGLGGLAAIVLPTITKSSIWFDEAFSAYISHFSFLDIVRYTAADVHPPLYYWLLKIWEMPFGYSALAIRSLSLVFAGVAVVFGFLLVRRLFGRKASAVSLLLLVLSPMLIRYSQEARMYTLAAAIVLAATYVLTFAVESKKKRVWVLYGILVALGMYTHYFTALVWIAHLIWRLVVTRQSGARGKEIIKKTFTKNLILGYIVAIGLFLPWLPFMAIQLGGIQGGGFWIGQVGINTPTNYITNMFYYQEHDKVQGWLAIILFAVVVGLIVLMVRVYRKFSKKDRQKYLLLILMAVVPVVLLMLASMPPLRSSFVERYLIPAMLSGMLLIGVTLVYAFVKAKLVWRIIPIIIVVALLVTGVANVYYYGNYNKNSNTNIRTGQLVQEIDAKAKPGEPIIANSPWIFYEAVFYSTTDHPVYFIDADTQYIYGSLDMLKDNDQHKIKDVTAFLKQNPVVWYIGVTGDATVPARTSNWQALQTISAHDSINNIDVYKGTEYQTQ